MTIRLYIDGERAGRQLATITEKHKGRLLVARRQTAKDVVDYVVPRVRADIKKGIKAGPRWTEGFQGKITEGGGFIRISFTQKVPFWRIFQFGGTIHGKPMLWIPLSFAKDAQGRRARDYPGKLIRVNRKGGKAPLLLAQGGEPKYFGKESVKIPKKFHTIEIIKEGAQKMGDFFRGHMRG